ncbi:putative eka-like protein [Erysiphe necator]|uniref:Putative eka-like protein n=1 Tax=Uncinula necator TaxID=52586 RepID=A0A0B1P600_UNCNE|nr:putative eka-like protein [Erysiphe necator]
MAITKFATVDSSPPQIPTHTCPTKRGKIGKHKSILKKVAIALLPKPICVALNRGVAEENTSLPNIPHIIENTWATVAHADQKKARIILNNITQVNITGRQFHRPVYKEKSKIPATQSVTLSDDRLFVRIPQEHDWRKLSSAGIREVIVKKLQISPSLIGKIKTIHSGFA